MKVARNDREILRRLASRVAVLANRDIEREKADLWTRHNGLQATRPLIFCDPENSWREIITRDQIECMGDLAREWEWGLRREIYQAETLRDDRVVSSYFSVGYVHTRTNWGLSERYAKVDAQGAYTWEAPIKQIEDIDKLYFQTITVDHGATERMADLAESVLGDILPVRLRMFWLWSVGLTWELIKLRGLEQFMLDIHENPVLLHKLMAFLRDGTMTMLDFLERDDLLTMNNENDYVGSGALGWTVDLPADDFDGHVRIRDMWGLAESQESVGISPAAFEEFVFQYHLPIISRFGLACYGCCEPVHDRWHIVKRIPNLRRVSVSPWCNREKMAEYLDADYIYSLKPNPALLAGISLDENALREDIVDALEKAEGCRLEIVMKDVHTLQGEPDRAARWVRIAREEIDKRY